MKQEIIFDELGDEQKVVLLRAFDYDVDDKGFILSSSGQKIRSEENPTEFLHVSTAALMPGSLNVLESSPTAISKYLRVRKMHQMGCK